jgi:hypothetical protein
VWRDDGAQEQRNAVASKRIIFHPVSGFCFQSRLWFLEHIFDSLVLNLLFRPSVTYFLSAGQIFSVLRGLRFGKSGFE